MKTTFAGWSSLRIEQLNSNALNRLKAKSILEIRSIYQLINKKHTIYVYYLQCLEVIEK